MEREEGREGMRKEGKGREHKRINMKGDKKKGKGRDVQGGEKKAIPGING